MMRPALGKIHKFESKSIQCIAAKSVENIKKYRLLEYKSLGFLQNYSPINKSYFYPEKLLRLIVHLS